MKQGRKVVGSPRRRGNPARGRGTQAVAQASEGGEFI
jgi:hypothetical protein